VSRATWYWRTEISRRRRSGEPYSIARSGLGVGHIGSALSVADIITAIYGGVLRAAHPHDESRDRFVLSKGHAALALYAALVQRGWLRRDARTVFGKGVSFMERQDQMALLADVR
jgi:transketolase